ncbi:MAG: hypothetical protein JKY19_16070 [Alcanivoracaceae bacterium]|nr:hypothetical protein [Alcanivoracaceae bacterium]
MQPPPEYYAFIETAVELAIESGMSFNELLDGFKSAHARESRKAYPDYTLLELADKTGLTLDYLAKALNEKIPKELAHLVPKSKKIKDPKNLYDINIKRCSQKIKKDPNKETPVK